MQFKYTLYVFLLLTKYFGLYFNLTKISNQPILTSQDSAVHALIIPLNKHSVNNFLSPD
jgi:hypothetical protein